MPQSKTLTPLQVGWLEAIARGPVATHALLNLKGAAKKYSDRYERSLAAAVDAHNAGTAKNSPIARGRWIERGSFGPKGGKGYRVAPLHPAEEIAVQVIAEEVKDAKQA